mmetsp:Transcript_15550/g.23564  ORF Transcript_15550/g.23564 Transcript_15550/m.23564 type:complete len:280 (+) Transcript_15550:70-909(+)
MMARWTNQLSPSRILKLAATWLLCHFSVTVSSQRPKILCLHGGGGNSASMAQAVGDLVDALPEFEFVFANAAYGSNKDGYLWISDPPGGKGEPTTDPAFADASIQALNDLVDAEGPFYGIMGYSQGGAFVPVYLSRVPAGTFQMAVTFCGYLTTTHAGILNVVNQNSPFGDIPHLVWMGESDFIISNSMTIAMSEIFTDPFVLVSPAGHYPPRKNDATFEQVTSWIQQQQDSNLTIAPAPGPTPGQPPPSSAPSNQSPTTIPFLLFVNVLLFVCFYFLD